MRTGLVEQIAARPAGPVLSAVVQATTTIARQVRRAGLVDLLGRTGETNVQDEEVQKLDAYADEVLKHTLARCGHVCAMASEEAADFLRVENDPGPYVVVFDPLDGSSNIDANAGVGTIFGIYERCSPAGSPAQLADLLQPGARQVAAGYVLYGPSTMFVYSAGDGVDGFTLEPASGEFLCSHPAIRTPARGGIYSVNESNSLYWSPGVRSYVKRLKSEDNARGKPYSSRYIGSLVADFHRNLLYGGIFLYPADRKDRNKPCGKLRLLYEANPLAFVAEQAGGAASNGHGPILDMEPTELHQRVPLFLGSAEDVAEAESLVSQDA